MKNRKGMVYTTFAIVATSLLILLLGFTATDTEYTSDTQPFRIGQASFYLQNVEEDFNRAYDIAFQRATSGLTNYIIETGNPVQPQEGLRNATVDGNISNVSLANIENATLSAWSDRVENAALNSQYSLEIGYSEIEVDDQYFNVTATTEVNFNLKDPVSLAEFNRTDNYTTTTTIEGLEDPMILIQTSGRYISTFEKCGYDAPAELLATANGNNIGPTYGQVTFDETAANKSTKILVTEVAPAPGQAENFAGIATQVGGLPGNLGDNQKTVTGLSSSEYNSIQQGMTLILADDQIWNSHIRDIINRRCYLKTQESPDLPQVGPGYLERTQNQLQSQDQTGLTTLLDKPDLPGEITREEGSSIAHVYFSNQDYGPTTEIQGITGDQAYDSLTRENYRENFRLNQQHLQHWNMTGLQY